MVYHDSDKEDKKFSEADLKRCDCGACFTSVPNYHYDWCTIFKPVEEKSWWVADNE